METAPITVQEWADLVVAAAAHRSASEKHAAFGGMLVQRYFVELPARYKDDETATRYFDSILCAAGSAIRAFSVVRDTFQTNCAALKQASDHLQAGLEKLDAYAPLSASNHWGKIAPAVVGLGLWGPIADWMRKQASSSNLVLLAVLVVLIAVSAVAAQGLVEWLKAKRMAAYDLQYPRTVQDAWMTGASQSYRKALGQFMRSAAEITSHYYPSDESNRALASDLNTRLSQILDERLVLGRTD